MTTGDSTINQAPRALGLGGSLIVFAFWTFMAVLALASRLLDPRGFGFRGMAPAGSYVLPFLEMWMWAALTPLIFLLSRIGLERRALLARVVVLALAGVAVAIVTYFLLAVVRDFLFEPPPGRHPPPFHPGREIGRFRFVPQLLFYFAILAAGFAREYFFRVRDQQARAARLQTQLAEARLDALRMQLNPHFLFNTLHAISAMVERNPAGVRKMIARLSELLRHTTDTRAADEVPLREELEFLGRYLEIMEVRFQGRLQIERRIDPGVLDALVPNLILQPIVENALEHGVSRNKGQALVDIAAERSGDRLLLTVRDNGPGLDAQSPAGVGLANTRARLSQLYGDEASLELSSSAESGTIARLTLPMHTKP